MSTGKNAKIAIVGRVNVGKSTLFNRLIGENKSLVSPIAGTTRDIQFGKADWRGYNFILVDTGGLLEKKIKSVADKKTYFLEEIHKQATKAYNEADIVIFTVDGKEGLLPDDKEIARLLRKNNKPVFLACNKVDGPKIKSETDKENWEKLGFGEPFFVSAASGSGTGDLLDAIAEKLKELGFKKSEEEKEKFLKITFIGKPNAGKSSLLNSILGEERVIVSPIPHTTREPQDTIFEYKERKFLLIDTAGIRKKAKVEAGLERQGVARSLKNLYDANIAFFVTDVKETLTSQDNHLAKTIINYGVGIIIVANKWDLIEEKETSSTDAFVDYYYSKMPHLSFAPIAFISAKTGQRVKKLLDLAIEVEKEREKIITDKALERFLKDIIKKHPPTKGSGAIVKFGKRTRHPYIYHIKQTGSKPPRFEIKISPKVDLNESYVRYIEKQLREKFGFLGTPIMMTVVNK